MNIDFKELKKYNWYIQSFNGTPVMIHMAGVSGTINMHQDLGYGYTHFILAYENDLCECYYDRADLHRVAHELENRILKDKNYFQNLVYMSIKQKNDLFDFVKKNSDFENFSDEELITKYVKVINLYVAMIGAWHVLEGYTLTRDSKLNSLLMQELQSKNLINDYKKIFAILTNTIKIPFVTDYKNYLIKLIQTLKSTVKLDLKNLKEEELKKIIESNTELSQQLGFIEENFYWIKASYQYSKRRTKKEFIEEIWQLIVEDNPLVIMDEEYFNNNQKEKDSLIEELNLSKELIMMIRTTDNISWWHDDRKKYLLKGCCAIDVFLEEISKRFGLNKQKLKYLLPSDLTFENFKNINEELLDERIKGCVIVYNKEGYEILTNNSYQEYKTIIKEKENDNKIKEVRGMSACSGKAVGKARICRTAEDIKNFQKGEILVAPMTRPEFLPAMQKAAAIVTDEGGLTCHAAIISRELNIPCIIGTKLATESFEDGMILEVNANHGVVVIKEDEEEND